MNSTNERLVVIDFLEINGRSEPFLSEELYAFLGDYLSRKHFQTISACFSSLEGDLEFSSPYQLVQLDEFLCSLAHDSTRPFVGTVVVAIPFSTGLAETIRSFGGLNVEVDPLDVEKQLLNAQGILFSSDVRFEHPTTVLADLLDIRAVSQENLKNSRRFRKGKWNLSAKNASFLATFIWYQACKFGRSLLCLTDPNLMSDREFRLAASIRSDFQCRRDHQFIESVSDVNNPDFFTTLLGRQLFDFNPKPKDIQRSKYLRERNNDSNVWGNLSFSPKRDEYDRWLVQEFGTRTIARQFLEVSYDSLLQNESTENGIPFVQLPGPIQFALGAIRLSRRMASWTLEGEPFECTVLLYDNDTVSDRGGLQSYSPLIDFDPKVPFNFLHEKAIRHHAELAQSQGLHLVCNVDDGKLHFLTSKVVSNSDFNSKRLEYFSKMVRRKGILVHIRKNGCVEVYAKDDMQLWWDGFKWHSLPFNDLRKKLIGFFSFRKKSSTPSMAEDLTLTVLNTVSKLMDRQESSIMIFLHPEDKNDLSKFASEQLREGWRWSIKSVPIEDLDPEAFAGLMHLDGAHVISPDGTIVSVARRIDLPTPRYQISLQDFSKKEEGNFNVNHSARSEFTKYIKQSERFEDFSIQELSDEKEEVKECTVFASKFTSLKRVSEDFSDFPTIKKLFKQKIEDETLPMLRLSYNIPKAISKLRVTEFQWRKVLNEVKSKTGHLNGVDCFDFSLNANNQRNEYLGISYDDRNSIVLEELKQSFSEIKGNQLLTGAFPAMVITAARKGEMILDLISNSPGSFAGFRAEHEGAILKKGNVLIYSINGNFGILEKAVSEVTNSYRPCLVKRNEIPQELITTHESEIDIEEILGTPHSIVCPRKSKRRMIVVKSILRVATSLFIESSGKPWRCYRLGNYKTTNSDWKCENCNLNGIGTDYSGGWYAVEGFAKAAAYCSDSDLPSVVRDAFRKLVLRGAGTKVQTTGTGTLVADRLAKRLHQSLVLKVSASGGVKIYTSANRS